jgi:hypothetical protein
MSRCSEAESPLWSSPSSFVDLALGALYAVDHLIGQPFPHLSVFLDLDGERNLPAWYSSMQWAFVGLLLAVFAVRNFRRNVVRSWFLCALPLLFLAMSLDESASIHEWIGGHLDVLLPHGVREHTAFSRTGLWVFVLGIPFGIGFIAFMSSLRVYFRRAPTALLKLVLGMGIMLLGAVVLEGLANLTTRRSVANIVEIFFEEVLEMAGVTVMLWGAYELLLKHGFSFALDRVNQDPI